VEFSSAAAVTCAYVRMFLVQDTQANGALGTMTGAQGALLAWNGVAANIHAFRDLDNVERYKVLKEWHHVMLPFVAGTNSYAKSQFICNKSVNIPVEYDASTASGAIASIRSNNLLLMAGTDVASGVLELDGYVRVRYIDN